MATVDIEIAARTYPVSCRDGEEPHLHALADLVDKKAKEAAAAVGNMGEARQLLFASLLLADELKELRSGAPGSAPAQAEPDPEIANALGRLAERMEMLADRLESKA
jgi:cell division protein ZapA